MILKKQGILGVFILYAFLISTACDDGPDLFSNADAGCRPPLVPPVARCGVWEPSGQSPTETVGGRGVFTPLAALRKFGDTTASPALSRLASGANPLPSTHNPVGD